MRWHEEDSLVHFDLVRTVLASDCYSSQRRFSTNMQMKRNGHLRIESSLDRRNRPFVAVPVPKTLRIPCVLKTSSGRDRNPVQELTIDVNIPKLQVPTRGDWRRTDKSTHTKGALLAGCKRGFNAEQKVRFNKRGDLMCRCQTYSNLRTLYLNRSLALQLKIRDRLDATERQ